MAGNNEIYLASESEIIFVNGFGGHTSNAAKSVELLANSRSEREVSVKENCWKLYCHVYHVRPTNQRKRENASLNVVLYESTGLGKVSGESVKQVQELLCKTPVDTCGITRIVFAHSHGAKVLFVALNNFEKFLANETNIRGGELDRKMQEIRDHLAIITLGGIQVIPKHHAKICYNLYLHDDKKAEAGTEIFGSDNHHPSNVLFLDDNGAVDKKIDHSFKHYVSGSIASALAVPTLPADALAVSVAGAASLSGLALKKGYDAYKKATSPDGRHYMHEYLENSAIMNKVLELLGISD